MHAGGGLGEGAGSRTRSAICASICSRRGCTLPIMTSSTPGWRRKRCAPRAGTREHASRAERQDRLGSLCAERPALIATPCPFDGLPRGRCRKWKSSPCADHNRYSVAVIAARRTAQLRATPDRIVTRVTVRSSGSMPAASAAARPPTTPWHYSPVLARKPGALRNGDPFRNWDLPPALAQIRRRLAGHDDGDRQFVDILTEVAEAGLDAVEAACAEALAAGLFGCDVVLNIPARQRDADPPPAVVQPRRRWCWRSGAGGRLRPLRPAGRNPSAEEAYLRGLDPWSGVIIELMGQGSSWPACAPATSDYCGWGAPSIRFSASSGNCCWSSSPTIAPARPPTGWVLPVSR